MISLMFFCFFLLMFLCFFIFSFIFFYWFQLDIFKWTTCTSSERKNWPIFLFIQRKTKEKKEPPSHHSFPASLNLFIFFSTSLLTLVSTKMAQIWELVFIIVFFFSLMWIALWYYTVVVVFIFLLKPMQDFFYNHYRSFIQFWKF